MGTALTLPDGGGPKSYGRVVTPENQYAEEKIRGGITLSLEEAKL